MRNNLLIGCLLLSSTFSLLAQQPTFEDRMVKRTINCFDIALNSVEMLEYYFVTSELDSAQLLLNFWQGKCGLTEPVFRAKTILSLHNQSFSGELTPAIMDYLSSYQTKVYLAADGVEFNNWTASYFDFVPINGSFNTLLARMAKNAIGHYEPGSTEHFLASFYGSDEPSLHEMMRLPTYHQSPIKSAYDTKVRQIDEMLKLHSGILGGWWMPTGEMQAVGSHPNIGFFIGGKKGKSTLDLSVSFKFLNAPNEYTAYRKEDFGLEVSTRHFFGGYFGIDYSRELIEWNRNEVLILAGAGIDGFDAIKEDEDNGISGESVFTYNFNAGLGYKYNLSHKQYLSLQAKYNLTDYALNGVVNYSGNAITLSLIWGFYTSPQADSFYFKRKKNKRKK
ncbi:MAG: hypothetical protein VYB44_05515 [Bacteroidota bacterium]|nr:hypothetical protein [Bacteroidota bacterium]